MDLVAPGTRVRHGRRRVPLALAVVLLGAGGEAAAQAPAVPSREYIYAGDRLLVALSPVVVTIDDVAVVEGQPGAATTASFTVSLSAPLPHAVTVGYGTENGTAQGGVDYLPASGTASIVAGATSVPVQVSVTGDAAVEARETFFVNLSGAVGATIARPRGRATIVDDEPSFFFPLQPCRLLDTRAAEGPSGGPALAANTSRSFPVVDLCGVPPTARSVAVIVTATAQSVPGNLRVYPAPGPLPMASVVNFRANRARAGNGIVALGEDGRITIRCDMGSGQAHVIVDVMGYFQ